MIDNVFSINSNFSLLYLCKPALEKVRVFSASDLIRVIRKQNNFKVESEKGFNLTDIIYSMYEKIDSKKNVGKFRKYLLREEAVFQNLESKKDSLKVPVFVNGVSVVDNVTLERKGVDPYSNSHVFSNRLLDGVPSLFSKEVYENFEMVYVQPLVYVQEMQSSENGFELVDFLERYTIENINPKIKGVGFGSLRKRDYSKASMGNSSFNVDLFDINQIIKGLKSFPDLYKKGLEEYGFDYRTFIEKKKYENYINSELMSIKYAVISDLVVGNNFEFLRDLNLSDVKLFMEKTSISAKIMDNVKFYLELFGKRTVPLSYIGGDYGIFQKSEIPVKGICDGSALNRLYGYMGGVFSGENKVDSKSAKLSKNVGARERLDFVSSKKYPFLEIERGFENKHPNFEDVCDIFLSEQDPRFAKDMLEEVKKYSYMYRVSNKRVEPRLVELMNQDLVGFDDFRVFTKRSFNFYERHKNKRKVFPNEINGFFNMNVIDKFELAGCDNDGGLGCVRRKKADFRGSEFSLKTVPNMNPKWLKDAREGVIDVGCSIENLMRRISEDKIYGILQEVGFDLSGYSTHNYVPLIALRGTFLHEISSYPFEGLVHYDTLKLGGFVPTTSENYTETAFSYMLKDVKVSFHPDCYFFLEDKGEYDLVMIDKKTNRKTAYPEHKYLLQTFFYGWSVKKAMKEELGLKVNDVYCVLDKMAFYTGFDNEKIYNPVHEKYREQLFSPVICFNDEHFLNKYIPLFVEKKVEEVRNLEEDLNFLKNYRRRIKKQGGCNCYTQTEKVCDYFSKLDDVKFKNLFKK